MAGEGISFFLARNLNGSVSQASQDRTTDDPFFTDTSALTKLQTDEKGVDAQWIGEESNLQQPKQDSYRIQR